MLTLPSRRRGAPASAEELLANYARRGWDSEPFEAMLSLARRGDGELLKLVVRGVATLSRSTTFVDAAVSLLDSPDLITAGQRAVHHLEQHPAAVTGDSAAEGVIAELSLQAPEVLTSSLHTLWALAPNGRAYYAEWPWRACSDVEADRLLAVLAEGPEHEQHRAWAALLQSRRPDDLVAALAAPSREGADCIDAQDLPEVGLALQDGQVRRLHPVACYHLTFPADLLERMSDRPVWLQPANHPSWRADGELAGVVDLGGLSDDTCGSCHQRLQRLITFTDGIPADLDVTAVERLELAVCLSCLDMHAPLYYRHGGDGVPHPLTRQAEPSTPDWISASLLEAKCTLVRTDQRWRRQDWAISNGRQNLNRVGGEPTWIQHPDYPACPSCEAEMHALMQLDSFLPTTDDGELYWGSGGIGYVLWCDTCAISGVTAQWT